MGSVYKWNEALSRAARHIVNDNACGIEGDIYGNDFIDVLAKYYAYAFDEVYFTKITASIILDQEPAEPNVINFIDNILGQKSIEKSILRSHGAKYMGVGCSCAPENVNRPNKKIYSCIIATANHVITKDIEERIPRYGDVLAPEDMCMDTCDYLSNDEESVSIPFNTYSCSEEDSVPDANGFCVPCYEQIRDCEFCAGDDTCLACLPEDEELKI